MPTAPSPLQQLHQQYLNNEATPHTVLDAALAHSNTNAGHNVYLAQDPAWSRAQADALNRDNIASQALWGIPISLKDCFDLAGFPTSCGSTFYRDHNGLATQDSAVATRLKQAGALITGKTHLHQLAYGITGENRDFDDCLQPSDPTLLTGGSSSGAAASVQEGSALAAIGTDTGGSIRVPAALCGLAGFRDSIATGAALWSGGAHLSPTFDTLGWLYRDLRDGPILAHALFNLPIAPTPDLTTLRIALPPRSFLHDCDPDILRTMASWATLLERLGATFAQFDATYWSDAVEIFTNIQAHEAAIIHHGNLHHFEPAIAARMSAATPTTPAEQATFDARYANYQSRKLLFEQQTADLFTHADYLLLPCAPVSKLIAHEDQSETRTRILRYTAPISLAGLPTVTLPGVHGGLQLAGPPNSDAILLALSAHLGTLIALSK